MANSSSRQKREQEQKNVVDQVVDFAKDSKIFFDKCAKPSKKGKSYIFVFILGKVYKLTELKLI